MNATLAPAPVFRRGDLVRHTDRQGVVTVGRVRRISLLRSYADPKKIAARYYVIEGYPLAVADGLEAA